MSKKSILIILLILGLVFSGCAAQDNYAEIDMMTAKDEAPRAPMAMEDGDIYYSETTAEETSNTSGGEAVDYSEKIIYNVNMGITVDDPVKTAREITEKVSALGGYVSSSYTNKGDGSYSYVNMQVRVPAAGRNNFTEYVYSISEDVDYDNMYSDNVTEDYYDIVTRLEHEKAQEEQLLEIMDKAETIEDILIVRRELTSVQETIEVYEGRIRMWDSLVDYSTIDIYIQPTPTIDNDNNGLVRLITLGETGRGIVRALNNSWRYVANFFSRLLIVLAALAIPAVIIVPVVILIVRLTRNRKAKKNNPDNQG